MHRSQIIHSIFSILKILKDLKLASNSNYPKEHRKAVMETISTELTVDKRSLPESFVVIVPITRFLKIKFYLDRSIQMTSLINVEKDHVEYNLTKKEFDTLIEKYEMIHATLSEAGESSTLETGDRVDRSLVFNKNDGVLYLKGCADERCLGIQMPPCTVYEWKHFKKLLKVVFYIELSLR